MVVFYVPNAEMSMQGHVHVHWLTFLCKFFVANFSDNHNKTKEYFISTADFIMVLLILLILLQGGIRYAHA